MNRKHFYVEVLLALALWFASSCTGKDANASLNPNALPQAPNAVVGSGGVPTQTPNAADASGGAPAQAPGLAAASAGAPPPAPNAAAGSVSMPAQPGVGAAGSSADADAGPGALPDAAVGGGDPTPLRPRDPSPNAPPVTVTRPTTTGKGPFSVPDALGVGIDLSKYGYVQEEFFFEGDAISYTLQGGAPMNGKWTAVASSTKAAYRSRMLVRRPTDAAKFNGTVVVEWFNVTSGSDIDVGFLYNQEEALREGYVWVGVSAQKAGIDGAGVFADLIAGSDSRLRMVNQSLKMNDPERYSSLVHPGDKYSFDIFTQAAEVIRNPGSLDVLGGLEPKRLMAYGESQSAFCMVTYVDAVHPLVKVYDGFFIHSRNESGVAIDGTISAAGPLQIRTDLEQPVFQFQTDSDVYGALAYWRARQPDSDRVHTWEVAGTAHIDQSVGTFDFKTLGCSSVNNGPQRFVVKAALHAVNRWMIDGTAPPGAQPMMLDSNGSPRLDANGNVLGGVRSPDVDVPIATNSGIGEADNFVCFLFGTTTPFTPDKLRSLYPTHEDYVSKVSASARSAAQAGFLLAPEEQAIVDRASAAQVPP